MAQLGRCVVLKFSMQSYYETYYKLFMFLHFVYGVCLYFCLGALHEEHVWEFCVGVVFMNIV